MIDDGVAAFGDSVLQTDWPIGVEGLAVQMELVGGDLPQRAA